jgi:hypothetical protein
MKINIDNPERSLNIIHALLKTEYPIELRYGIQEWLVEIKNQILESERTERLKDTWRRIPSFPQYEINGVGHIRHRDDEDVWVQPMPNGDGVVRLQKSRGTYVLSVQNLINETFPEIKA